ncbi:MAG: condensation domain-containing protein, partial [Pseudonocardia sp.]
MPVAEQLRYWTGQLDGVSAPELPTDQLPTDQVQPAGAPSATGEHAVAVPGDVAAEILTLTAQLDLTLLEITVAACQVLLARYSGQEDIAVAPPAPGLGHPLVLRSQCSDARQLFKVLAEVHTRPFSTPSA